MDILKNKIEGHDSSWTSDYKVSIINILRNTESGSKKTANGELFK